MKQGEDHSLPKGVTLSLPKGWKIMKLGSIATIMYGFTAKSSTNNYGPKYLRITDIQNNEVNWDCVPNCPASSIEIQKYRLSSGDIVFARTGATTGKSYIIENAPIAIFASYLIRVQIKKDSLLPHFLFLFFQSPKYWETIEKGITGSAQGGFNAAKLSELNIPIPPLPEQQRIVSILDNTFTAIDKAKANIEKNLKNAKEVFESYLESLLKNKAKEWEIKTLNQISENLDNKRVPITKNVRSNGSIPYYGASGIVDYVADYIFDEDLLCISEDGANLLARTYPIAFSISGKTWVNNHAHIIKFKNIISQRFVELYFNSIKFDNYVSGMAQPKLNQAMLNSIPIPYPSITEQQTIVQKFDVLSAETKKLKAIYQKKMENLEELKKSILQRAFEGEL